MPSEFNIVPPPIEVTTLFARFPNVVVTANNWLPLMASVEESLICPAATLVTVRSLPAEPTLTVLSGAVPANPPYVRGPTVAEVVPTAAEVVE